MSNILKTLAAGLRWICAPSGQHPVRPALECHHSLDEQWARLPVLKKTLRLCPGRGFMVTETRGYKKDRYGEGGVKMTRTWVVPEAKPD